LDTAAGWEMDGWMGKTELVASWTQSVVIGCHLAGSRDWFPSCHWSHWCQLEAERVFCW